jgi:hypothetical protein
MITVKTAQEIYRAGSIDQMRIVLSPTDMGWNILIRYKNSIDFGIIMNARGKPKIYKIIDSAVSDINIITGCNGIIYDSNNGLTFHC